MSPRHPIRSMIKCPVCGARRRIDHKRVRVFAQPTTVSVGRDRPDVVIDAGVHICWHHQTVAEFEADETRRARSRGEA